MADKFQKLKNVKILLFDMEGVLIKTDQDHDPERLKSLTDSLKQFCTRISRYGLKGGIVTATDDLKLIKEFKEIPCCEILTSTIDKVSMVDKLKDRLNIEYENIFYIGDDILDIPLLGKVGFSAAPNNSRREVKRVVDYICPAEPGEKLLEDIGDLFDKILSE